MFGPRQGTSEIRKLTLKDEIVRVLLCCGFSLLFAWVILGSLYFEAILHGPILGVLIGIVTLSAVVPRHLLNLTYESDTPRYREVALGLFTALIFSWIGISYPLFSSIWPKTLPWDLPLWAHLLIFSFLTCLQVFLVIGIYLLMSEAFDPNGPTTTRKPIEYAHTIWPWTQVHDPIPIPEPSPVQPRMVRIHHERLNAAGRAANRDLLLPDTAGWRQYARALANRATSFSEGGAKNFNISPQDKVSKGVVTEMGFRSVRDLLIARKYLSYLNPDARNMGYEFTDDFYELMDEFGTDPEEEIEIRPDDGESDE